ncbi:MAG TPA: BadF/BadG/BcrA/BcrD ATPase family protein, partial [Bryobacteraceae bacterium]|nr:BadF/BadG/BcrA/BcrD ATPase family protein [Bryobacteraceae bacterium]
MRLYLGIDGGQSGTVAMIAHESGRVVGMGRGGPCNHVGAAEGRARFLSAIETSMTEACAAAALQRSSVVFESVCAGFSGGPADKESYLRELIPSRATHVTTDALIALSGATAGGPGIITIAGTGSIAWGRNAEKRVARAGGWGYIFGDEGGGFDLTRQALRAVLRHEEGWGPATILRELLLEASGAADANELMHRFYTPEFPRARVASFARLVDKAATHGDPVAGNLILNAAQQLATAASAVRSQLFGRGETAEVAHIGGVFGSRMLLERFRMLVELEDGNAVIAPRYGPAAGALIEAMAAAGSHAELTEVPQ